MIRKPLSWNIKQVCTMIGRGTITFDNPVQRPPGQWKIEDKSLLIHSVLKMFVPDIYAIQIPREINGKIVNTYDVIDGKQRLTTLDSFRRDEWALTKLEPVTLESTGETYDISGQKYSELHEDVRNEIDGYTLTIKAIELEEDDDEEEIVEEIFYRLNNGKAVSRGHLALISAESHVQKFVRDKVDHHPLFTQSAHFAEGSIKNSDRELTVMQSILLVGGYEWSTFNAKDIEKAFVNNEISQEDLNKVNVALDMLHQAFPEYNKFVNKVNIPSFVNLIIQNDYNSKTIAFLRNYAETTKKGDLYRRYTGAGGTKKNMVEGRIRGLQEMYDQFKG